MTDSALQRRRRGPGQRSLRVARRRRRVRQPTDTPRRCAHYHGWLRPHRPGACASPPIPRANERTRKPQKWCRGMLGHRNLFEGYPAAFVVDQGAERAGESSRVGWKRLRPVNAGCEQGILGHVLRQVNTIRGYYALRANCYTPLPHAGELFSRSWGRGSRSGCACLVRDCALISLYNFGAVSRARALLDGRCSLCRTLLTFNRVRYKTHGLAHKGGRSSIVLWCKL